MQSKAHEFGALNERVQTVETQMAKPNYKMGARLMWADFNMGARKLLQSPDDFSPPIDYLLYGLAQVPLVQPTLDECSERRLFHGCGPKIIYQFGPEQVVAYSLRANDVA